jgi:methylthioribulose-1-phosphate dehydratase
MSSSPYSPLPPIEAVLRQSEDPREIIVALCRAFYRQGWVSGTGGGVSIREGDRVYMAPSGVQKELLHPDDLYVLGPKGELIEGPRRPRRPGEKPSKISACAPLFYAAFELRGAGAVLHSHSVHAMLATLLFEEELRVTHLEMMKGIKGTGYHDELVVPIIENTAHESDLADAMRAAIEAYPKSQAVLVRRHGVYVWGQDWVAAKTQAECYDYLFEAAVKMKQMGLDPAAAPA